MRGTRSDPYDVVVLGGGTAGLTIGKYGARLGAAVAIVEAERLGGDCTWTGCVPSKGLLAAAHAAAAVGRTTRVGLPPARFDPATPIDLAAILQRVHACQQVIYARSDADEHVRSLGCDVIAGRGVFQSPRVLRVGDRNVHARAFCIATGSRPIIPPIDGIDTVEVLTNHNVFELAALPPRLLVLGAGPVGVEMAQAFQRLGSRVHLLEAAPEILPREDPELAGALRRALQGEGAAILTGVTLESIHCQQDGALTAVLPSGATLEADRLLVAAGQAPNTANLGLDAAGVETDSRGAIRVDARLRTSNPRIFAAGDVRGQFQFTHTAARDGQIVLRNALFPGGQAAPDEPTPWAIFTDPELARVGLTEAEARRRHGRHVRVSSIDFNEVDRAVLEDRAEGGVKLIWHATNGQILGAHILGPAAGELIHEFVMAMQFKIPVHKIAGMIHVYPTLSEAPRFAGMDALMGRLRAPWIGVLRRAYRAWDRRWG